MARYRTILKKLIGKYFPVLLKQKRKKMLAKEPILSQLSILCNSEQTSIDVGCAIGTFIQPLLNCSLDVVAFEPNTVDIDYIKNLYRKKIKSQSLVIHNLAVSNSTGIAKLLVPNQYHALSSLSQYNHQVIKGSYDVFEEIEVETKKLDDFDFINVGFIKIDVEGHEYEVLEGGYQLIRHCLPTLYIEIEERHAPGNIKKIFEFLSKLSYDAFYFYQNRYFVLNVDNFSIQEMQNESNLNTEEYINNFIFVQPSVKQKIIDSDLA